MKYIHSVKRHLKARTPKMLEQEQLRNNVTRGIWFKYTDFTFVNGYWYCWYQDESKNNPIESAGELNGNQN
jgi:hypothetical protein